jgi:small subunit ribosomal protein S8
MQSINQLFSTLQNGQRAGKFLVSVQKSKMNKEILNLMLIEGLIIAYGPSFEKYKLVVCLKYKNKEPVIKRIQQISSAGKRVYLKAKKLQKLPSFSFLILSTSEGLMTNQKAAKLNLGGEAFCQIF